MVLCCSSLLFFHLYLLYGVGIAYGLAKNNDGAAALAGAIGVLIAKAVYLSIDKDLNSGCSCRYITVPCLRMMPLSF